MIRKLLLSAFTAVMLSLALPGMAIGAETGSGICQSAGVWKGLIKNICWSCIFPMRIMGVGSSPEGAAPSQPVCYCTDQNGVPEVGWQLSFFQPVKIVEVVQSPWCSPFLEGVSLQSSSFDMGKGATNRPKGGNEAGFYDVHLWEFPILVMLKLLIMGDCTAEPYIDPSLTYISEVDPLWENDLLTLVLNPEAVVFANPIASMWCAADCVKVTAGADNLSAHFCAGCDGNLYPLTGHGFANADSVRVSSLLTQRMITKLHRQGMLMKTMGQDAMCERRFSYFMPRSQYRLSMLYPVPEAEGPECCHRLGDSVHDWSTRKGGRKRIGVNNYVYMLWRYNDCCVRWLG